jgi:uridine kinase
MEHLSGRCCILVAGPSGAGKSLLAERLKIFAECDVLELDRYYKDSSAVPSELVRGESHPQWDCPEAVDFIDAERVLRTFFSGSTEFVLPVFSFAENRRIGYETKSFQSRDRIVVDGTLAFSLDHPCRTLGIEVMRVFVDAPLDVRVRRVLRRDPLLRRAAESKDDLDGRWELIRRAEDRWIYRQRDVADIVVESG